MPNPRADPEITEEIDESLYYMDIPRTRELWVAINKLVKDSISNTGPVDPATSEEIKEAVATEVANQVVNFLTKNDAKDMIQEAIDEIPAMTDKEIDAIIGPIEETN